MAFESHCKQRGRERPRTGCATAVTSHSTLLLMANEARIRWLRQGALLYTCCSAMRAWLDGAVASTRSGCQLMHVAKSAQWRPAHLPPDHQAVDVDVCVPNGRQFSLPPRRVPPWSSPAAALAASPVSFPHWRSRAHSTPIPSPSLRPQFQSSSMSEVDTDL